MFPAQSSTLLIWPGHAVRLPMAGRLDILEGRAWLTRDGDLDDHYLEPGEAMALAADSGALVEAWGREPVRIAWSPASGLARLEAWLRELVGKVVEHNGRDDGSDRTRPRGLAGQAGRRATGAA